MFGTRSFEDAFACGSTIADITLTTNLPNYVEEEMNEIEERN